MSEFKYISPLRYPGGKQKAIKILAPLVPKVIKEFREPFVGGGSMFLHMRSLYPNMPIWINDLFADLIAFWKHAQLANYQLVQDLTFCRTMLKTAAEVRGYFNDLIANDPPDDYCRALRFFFLNRVTYSGTIEAGGFSNSAAMERFTQSSIERLKPLADALGGVRITNQDYSDLCTTGGDDVFLYLDPPYYSAKKLYGKKGILHTFDHERLAATLQQTKHNFMLSYDDVPFVRDQYKWANVRSFDLVYGMSNCKKSKTSTVGKELIITNY